MTAHIPHLPSRRNPVLSERPSTQAARAASGGLKAAVLGALIAIGLVARAEAEPAAGTYVTPGLSVILKIEACDETVCASVKKGHRHLKQSAKSIAMGRPDQGGEWRYMQLHDQAGGHAVWLRQDTGGTLHVLGCSGLNCQRMVWQPLGIVTDALRHAGASMAVATF